MRQQPHSFLFADYSRIVARRFESECQCWLITERCDVRHCRMVHADEILPLHWSSYMWATRRCKLSASLSTKEGGYGWAAVLYRLRGFTLPHIWSFDLFGEQELCHSSFSRMYGTSCSTCHIDFPKLNDFGKAFKDAGFKFPKDDESMIKIPPVMLGAPANAELWPKAIWPGTIPGIPPIGLRMNNYFQYTGTSSGKFASLTPAGTCRRLCRLPISRRDCSASSPPATSAATSPSGSTMTSALLAPTPTAAWATAILSSLISAAS